MTSTTRITTPYTRETTSSEIVEGLDLTGKRAFVTGGASGLGAETARALAAAHADVTIGVRDLKAGQRTAAGITSRTGNKNLHVAVLELTDQASIAAVIADWDGPLDILVNNAGVSGPAERKLTPEGWEHIFATNHLGHLALSIGLHDALAASGNARIVSLSSNAHRVSPIVFDDIHFNNREFDAFSAYGQSKTATALFAVEADKRWAVDGIYTNAVAPGGVRTGLQRFQSSKPASVTAPDDYAWKTLEQGASTPVLLAASPLLDGVSGRYFEDNAEAIPTDDLSALSGVRPHATDPEAAARLWEVSLEMLNG